MIRRGKADGWLSLPSASLRDWAIINGVELHGVEFGAVTGHESRGTAIKARTALKASGRNPLMVVPKELIISRDNVHLHAKSDRHLREVLDAAGDFGKTARGAILIFLLVLATHSCPDIEQKIGAACPFTDYVKFIPIEELPTFWSEEELAMLAGTSLATALDAKIKSLYREYDDLRRCTVNITWCQKYWWDEIDGMVTFNDWKQVDSMYRSRALEFPGIGDVMVPCVDMANHASGDRTIALYEADDEGDGLLLLRPDRDLVQGEEITITYGDEKGACEMLFSYGFIEDNIDTARDILLGLDIPDDDPLKLAKKAAATDAPGVRLFDTSNGLRWESEYVWLICVNEEDGFQIELLQSVNGERELRASWKAQELLRTQMLKPLLEGDRLWEVFHLRAITILQARVEDQLQQLMNVQASANNKESEKSASQNRRHALAAKLRVLEFELLERFYEYFEAEKLRLAETDTVRQYLFGATDLEPSSRSSDDFS